MGKHSLRRNRSRSVTTAVLAGGIVASTAPLLPSAHADDVDALIEQMESASHDATAKAVTAASGLGGEIHVLVAGEGAEAAASAAANCASIPRAIAFVLSISPRSARARSLSAKRLSRSPEKTIAGRTPAMAIRNRMLRNEKAGRRDADIRGRIRPGGTRLPYQDIKWPTVWETKPGAHPEQRSRAKAA